MDKVELVKKIDELCEEFYNTGYNDGAKTTLRVFKQDFDVKYDMLQRGQLSPFFLIKWVKDYINNELKKLGGD